MPSYVITGASGAIGFEFLRQVSADPENVVVGLVRNKAKLEERIAKELSDRKNIHIVTADLEDHDSIQKSVEPVSKILNGSVDYLVANAAYLDDWSEFKHFKDQALEPEKLITALDDSWRINVVGQIHLFNSFIPLLLKSNIKKVVALASGLADTELTAKYEISPGMPYSVSKAALNMVIAKYHAEYAKDGVVFMGICPGTVENGRYNESMTDEAKQGAMEMFAKFQKFAPDFKGPDETPERAVRDILSIVEKANLEDGWGGSYTSHNGGKQWL